MALLNNIEVVAKKWRERVLQYVLVKRGFG